MIQKLKFKQLHLLLESILLIHMKVTGVGQRIIHIQDIYLNSKLILVLMLKHHTIKYTVKDDDYVIKDVDGNIDMDMSKEAVLTLDTALAYRRLVAFGGVFKEVHDLLKLDDAVDGDLVVTDNDILREDIFTAIESYGWNIGVGNYILKKTQTPEDYFYQKNTFKIR